MGVGCPQTYWLQEFGSLLWSVFGEDAYIFHVGSSLEKKDGWRDVDIRVCLSDSQWTEWKFLETKELHHDPKWVGLCLAFSELGKKMTGLPIDFQIQKLTDANEEFKDRPRSFIGNRVFK